MHRTCKGKSWEATYDQTCHILSQSQFAKCIFMLQGTPWILEAWDKEMQTIPTAHLLSAEVLPSSRKSGICWYGSNVTVIWRNSLPRKGTNTKKNRHRNRFQRFPKQADLNLSKKCKQLCEPRGGGSLWPIWTSWGKGHHLWLPEIKSKTQNGEEK